MNAFSVNHARRKQTRKQRRQDYAELVLSVLEAKDEFDAYVMRNRTLSDEDRWDEWVEFLRLWRPTLLAVGK